MKSAAQIGQELADRSDQLEAELSEVRESALAREREVKSDANWQLGGDHKTASVANKIELHDGGGSVITPEEEINLYWRDPDSE